MLVGFSNINEKIVHKFVYDFSKTLEKRKKWQ
jgi:hypothetical protein